MYSRFPQQSIPWLCLGDFNEILWPQEKWGGNAPDNWRMNLLHSFISNGQLRDLHFQGPAFTWFALKHGRVNIKERLDRAFGNSAWCSTQSRTQVFHLPKIGSDHRPIIVDTSPTETRGRKLFRYEQLWLTSSNISPMKNWYSNLGKCRSSLQAWSKNTFPNSQEQINRLTNDLEALYDSDLPDSYDQIAGTIDKITILWDRDEMYWKQRSRVNWLHLGDQNTRFFHQTTLQRRQYNKILRLQDDSGNWLETELDISNNVLNYFQHLYTTSGPQLWPEVLDFVDHIVTPEMNLSLQRPISLQEVKSAVFDLGATKAPGPDGFSGTFYQAHWEIVQSIIHLSASQQQSTSEILHQLNQTHIALIPKVKNPTKAAQFRPIALCNFSYKILSKVWVNRLKHLMPDLISENQSAFVQDRQIQDNIIVAHEVFHHLKLRKSGTDGAFGLKLDMNKAYDRVEWSFLEKVLIKMGFSSCWTSLVMNCVRSVSYSVMINGKAGPWFKPSRGLRQGDPLSPFLFLFINDVPSRMMIKACQSHQLNPICLSPGGFGISHLFFADDSLFFLQATLQNCEHLSDLLHTYCSASGQLINADKSSLYFSPNTPWQVTHLLSSILQMRVVSDPGKYLGLPTIWGRSKRSALGYIKEVVSRKVQAWKQATLSQSGKETLIKAVATAIPAYPMACFKFPISTCREINSMLSNFWWGNSGSNGIHWKSWEFLGLPKEQGGLGFRNLQEFNDSLLAKQAWRLHNNPSSLYAQVLKQRYFPNSSFLQARKGSSPY